MAATKVEPGATITVRAHVDSVDGENLNVTIDGPRPPFTAYSVTIGPNDLVAVLDDPVPAVPPLALHDKVRDAFGREYEVIGIPSSDDGEMTQVALWSEEYGGTFEFPASLERVTE
jgi:hypothetical protein